MKLKLAAASALLCTALPSLGFLKVESKNTVNKDGSAKFSGVIELDLSSIMAMTGQSGKNPLGDGKSTLVEMVRGMSPNVDVWSDARVETIKGGGTRFTFSGFTKDWRAMGDLKKALASNPQSAQIPLDDLPELKFMDMKDDASGNTIITMAGLDQFRGIIDAARKSANAKGKGPKPGETKVDRDEIDTGLKTFREQWNGMIKGIATPLVKGISIKSDLEVSGTITEVAVFKKSSDNTATFTFNGDQLLSLADQIINDEELPGKIVDLVGSVEQNFDNEKATDAIVKFVEPYLKTVYGGSTNPKIVIKPGDNAFDYEAETAKAKANQSSELKAILSEAKKPAGKVKLPGSTTPSSRKKGA